MMKRRNAAAPERAEELNRTGNVNHVEVGILRGAVAMGHGRVGDAGAAIDMTNTAEVGVAGVVGQEEDDVPVKKRRTKNYKWREDMAKKSRVGGILTRVPALEPAMFANWDEFIRAWTEYMVHTKTLYRRRSSCSTASWNSKNRYKTFPVPDTFQYATMAYWCTHGCIQPSRGTGVRAHLHNRFTGCTARITADVVYEKGENNEVRWFIRVRNQISQHNHRISDEIFACYTNNSSVPDELLLGSADETQQDERTEYNAAASAEAGDFEIGAAAQDASAVANSSLAYNGNTALAKEVLVDEQKVNMARTELQPLLDELRRTPSRVIHKRLQDVSELVMHLTAKWEQDRVNEERHLHFIAQSAANAASAEQQRLLAARTALPEEALAIEEAAQPSEVSEAQEVMETEII